MKVQNRIPQVFAMLAVAMLAIAGTNFVRAGEGCGSCPYSGAAKMSAEKAAKAEKVTAEYGAEKAEYASAEAKKAKAEKTVAECSADKAACGADKMAATCSADKMACGIETSEFASAEAKKAQVETCMEKCDVSAEKAAKCVESGKCAVEHSEFASAQASKDAPEKAELGKQAPGFTLKDHNGEHVSLSDFAGKTVVLEFTNPECPFVVRHYKHDTMEKLAAENEDVVWLAVNSSHHHGVEANKKWAESEGLKYPVLDDSAGDVGRAYGAKTTPHMFVINPEGVLVYDGAIDSQSAANGPIAEDTVNYVAKAIQAIGNGGEIDTAKTQPYGCSVKYSSN